MSPQQQHRWLLLGVVSLGLFMVTIDNSVLYTALPALTRDLGANASEGLWIINAYPLVMAGLLLGAGTLGDKIGQRPMFLWGLVVFGIASVVAAFAPTPSVLIAARAFLAVGAAMIMPATLALIRHAFENERERNTAIGVWGSVSVVGAALGPIVAGILLEHFWWGSVFLVNLPVVVIALIGGAIYAPRMKRKPNVTWDFFSSLLALVGLAALVLVIKESVQPERSWLIIGVSALVCVVALGWFARRQRQLPYPLLDFTVFRSRPVSAGVIGAGLSMFAIAGFELVTAQRFQLAEGFTPLRAGLIVACMAVGSLPACLFAGAVMHRVGATVLIAGGLALGAAGAAFGLAMLPVGLGWFALGLGIAGAGVGGAMAASSAAIMGNIKGERAGMGSSVEEVSYEFGALTSVAVLGSTFSVMSAAHGIPAAYNLTVIIGIAALAVAALVCWLLLRGQRVAVEH